MTDEVYRYGGPAKGSWPQFKPGTTVGMATRLQPGHEVSIRHGAHSPRKVDPLATELLEATLAQAMAEGSPTSYLAEASYRPALWSWARCEVRIQLVVEWLEGKGDVDDEGEIRPAANLLTQLEAQALKHRERLGLDPLARARLGRDVAAGTVDLAQLMARLADEEADGADDASSATDGDLRGDAGDVAEPGEGDDG